MPLWYAEGMDNETNIQQSPIASETQVNQTTGYQKKQPPKKFYLLIVSIFLVGIVIAFLCYFFIFNKTSMDSSLQVKNDFNIPSGLQTISFASMNGEVVLQYEGKFYGPQKFPDQNNIVSLANGKLYRWKNLISRPQVNFPYYEDSLFDFIQFQTSNDFAFIMNWQTEQRNYVHQDYEVYYYDSKHSKLHVLPRLSSPKDSTYVPTIDQVSLDHNFISFNMHSCWQCDPSYPETLLFNLGTNKFKRIGQVYNFAWKENGAYTYKEYKVVACDQPQPGDCTQDPATLPALHGKF